MITIHGKLDSLEKIRFEFDHRKISEFNSIGDIKHFLEHYEDSLNVLQSVARSNLSDEIEALKVERANLSVHLDELLSELTDTLQEHERRHTSAI
ncbi:MAG: hypothetical protein AAFQ02_07595 [Bacteroidota bacterium]